MDPNTVQTLPSYSPEEERLIIRNKAGVPVGIRPHHRWTARSIATWVVITALGVVGWWMLAIVRGENVNTIWFVITAVCTYAIGYRYYALYIQRTIMRPDDSNATRHFIRNVLRGFIAFAPLALVGTAFFGARLARWATL